jgi:hypothetical protein
MTKTLLWIAIAGIGLGSAFLALAYALGGHDIERVISRGAFTLQACKEGGTATERRLPWTGGEAIDIAMPASVRLRAGEGSDIVVRGSPDLIANVELRGHRLLLDCRWVASTRHIEVTLPGQAFRRISLLGSGRVTLENLSQPELALNISGSGNLSGQGAVDRLSVTIAGSGSAKLAEIATKQLTVKISGSGNVEAAPKDDADITISGSGDVRLASRPARLTSHIAGSGRVTQAPLESADGKK